MIMRTAAVLCLSLAWAASVEAKDLWVDVSSKGGTCSDSLTRAQVTKATPWCSLARAALQAQAGDTVYARAGTYSKVQTCPSCDDNAVLQLVVYGAAGAPIRFMPAPGEQAVIAPGSGGAAHGIVAKNGTQPFHVEVSGFKVTGFAQGNCVGIKKASQVVLGGLEVTGCTGSGAVELHETGDVTLEKCRIHDNATNGWTSPVDLYLCKKGNVVRGNWIHDNQDAPTAGNPDSEGHGITMDTCEASGGALIENNVIWGNEGWCMAIYRSDGGTIRNNTCWTNGTRAGAGEISLYGNNHSVHNNILVPRSGRLALNIRYNQSYAVTTSTLAIDGNILWAPTHTQVVGWDDGKTGDVAAYKAQNPEGWGKSALQQDPKPADAASDDYQLQPGSPAVDSGLAGFAAALDILGVKRPQDGDGDGTAAVDRGAFELPDKATRADSGPADDAGPLNFDLGDPW